MKKNNRPIGVMDSGVGGLTVVKELARQLPYEKIIYFGDSAHCPYGEKSQNDVKIFTEEILYFLEKKDIKMFVIACNTATAAALEYIRSKTDIPVIGVITPGSRSAIQITNNNEVLVLSTVGTKESHAYRNTIHSINKNVMVQEFACPVFASLVESGKYKDADIRDTVIADTLKAVKNTTADTIILGCTHYPLIESEISNFFLNEKHIVDSGFETARGVSAILDLENLLCPPCDEHITHEFYINGSVEQFEQILTDWIPNLNYRIQSVTM